MARGSETEVNEGTRAPEIGPNLYSTVCALPSRALEGLELPIAPRRSLE